MRYHALGQYSIIRTRNAEELRADLVRLAGARHVDIRPEEGRLDARVNQRKLGDTFVFYSCFGAPLQIEFPPVGFFKLEVLLRGAAEVLIRGQRIELTSHGCCGLVADEEVAQRNSADLAHVVLRVDRARMGSVLEHLIGARPAAPLRFAEPVSFFAGRAAALRRLAMFLVSELETGEGSLHSRALVEIEQALIVAWLSAGRHNFSHVLEQDPRSVSGPQVRRVEEFIAAHWDSPIVLEELAAHAGTSLRSLFRSFKQARGYGPMAFAKRLRLEHAREMLRRAEHGTTTSAVALRCGFNNLGHFAADYRRAFGELPSATLQRAAGRRGDGDPGPSRGD